ncbi:MAG: PDZ domain-containing protein, partial [Ktedonobacterales bacterium]
MAYQGYIRFPTISGERIVFTAEDDLWLVTTDGGRAERLTSALSEASHARFSPDGQTLAFTGRDEGPAEVYTMPADGGAAQRLTWQGANAVVAGWRPDGSAIIYASAANQPMNRWQALQEVSPTGGIPTTLPYGPAHSLAFGPHGALVVGRNTADPSHWKRYRGGTAGYLWVDADGSGEFKRLPTPNSNIADPCWVGERIYFISDHEGIGNVYSCLPDGGDLLRHTQHTDYYARSLASDGRQLVYHAGGDLYLLDPSATAGRKLTVTLAGARTQRARTFVPAGKFLDSWNANPQGHLVAITTRGKAYSFGNFDGAVIQHGDPDDVRYRHMAWLADGKRLVAIGDNGTEPRLVVFEGDERNAPRVFDALDIGHITDLRPAPVGDQVALLNHRGDFLIADVAAGSLRVIDHTDHGRDEMTRRMRGLAWSPDGQWLAYSFAISAQQVAIKLANVTTGETHQITEPTLYDMQPAFDPNGKYLYFLGAREYDPVQDLMQFDWSFPKGLRPYLITLRRDLKSPFTPEPEAPKSEAAEQAEKAKSEEQPVTPKRVEIDLDGITTRITAFPAPEGRYGRVQGTHEGVVYTSFPVEGTLNASWADLTPAANGALEAWHFETHKQERLVDGVSDFQVTPNGKTLLYRAGERMRILKAGEKPPEGEGQDKPGRESGWLDLDRVKVSVRPGAEWRQMYDEAWRLQREQYWNAEMSGVDWQTVHDRYATLLDRISSRGELSDLIWEMQGELGSSHAYEIGGEYRQHPDYHQGSLGVDWRFDADSGRYTVTRIVRGDPWRTDWTSPLLAPGVNVAVGDAVLAINGQRLTAAYSPQQALANQAGTEVELLIQPADGAEARTVTVRAMRSDARARYRDWVEANRKAVHEATGGRVGYLHIPDMSEFGFAEFHRYFMAEYDHEGLIVDVRWNGGGMVSSLVLEKLMRPRVGYSFQRWGGASPYFIESPRGSLVALTDENAGSDGDIFSHTFKMLKLGPLVGKRTWGGVVGIEPYIPLADGTITTQPEFSFWFNDVGWGVENYGTDPNIEVDNTPQDYARGADPQLTRSIQEAQRLIEERPAKTPTPGPRP